MSKLIDTRMMKNCITKIFIPKIFDPETMKLEFDELELKFENFENVFLQSISIQ